MKNINKLSVDEEINETALLVFLERKWITQDMSGVTLKFSGKTSWPPIHRLAIRGKGVTKANIPFLGLPLVTRPLLLESAAARLDTQYARFTVSRN